MACSPRDGDAEVDTLVRLEVWVPALPQRPLSPNGGQRSRRNPHEVADAKLTLGDVAWHAVRAKYGPDVPTLTPPVIISLTLYAKHNAKTGDGLYRPTDPSNIGGDVAKPVIDAGLVKNGVIPDDTYKCVDLVTLRVEHVERLQDEGIALEVWEHRPDA